MQPSKWIHWQSYVAITSTILAGLGIYFGALIPLIDWLNAVRALAWFISFSIVFSGAFFLVYHEAKKCTPQVPTSLYASKILVFGLLWATFPYQLCSSSLFFKTIQKDCFCSIIPPDVQITLRKDNLLIQATDDDGIRDLLKRTKDKKPAYPIFKHPDDIQRVIDAMKKDAIEIKTKDFIKAWDTQLGEVQTTVMRLLADFSSSPLAPSEFSENFYKRLGFQIKRNGGAVLLTGDDALDAIEALMESGVSYEPLADDAIVKSIRKYISLKLTKLYGNLKYIPEHYTTGIDRDFIAYIKSIPFEHYEIVKLVAYPDATEDFRDFECGSPANGLRKSSYSRFTVPISAIQSPEVMDRMTHGPWPIGAPREFFSEGWWLEHAIWQMVARASGPYLDNLPLRIGEFNACGPP